MNSPGPRNPVLDAEEKAFILTIKLTETIEHEGQQKDEVAFVTIQPSLDDATRRAALMVSTEWRAELDEIIDVEILDGEREEQLAAIFARDDLDINFAQTIIEELVEYITLMPDEIAHQMVRDLPKVLRTQVEAELPPRLMDQGKDADVPSRSSRFQH